ncbi:MAG: ATP-binding protein [Eubacterium sp.]|nr:ATP-binding protein [Eubacterium sp.]
MKKIYAVTVGIVMLAILGVFIALCQFKSEDGEVTEYDVYEMNDNWRFISVTSVMDSLGGGQIAADKVPDTPGGAGKNPSAPPPEEGSDVPRSGMGGVPGGAEHDRDFDGGKEIPSGNADGETGETVSLPYKGTSSPGEMIVFQNTITQEYAGLTLAFYSTESVVRVSLDDDVIYQYGVESQRMFGKSPGSKLNFVDIPDHIGNGVLRIELVSSYENAAAELSAVSISQRDIMILMLIESNLAALFSCLVMLLCSVVFLITGIMCVRTNQNTHNVFWLAALSIDAGLYYLFKTEVLSVFFGVSAVYFIGQYLFIMLIPLFLLMYLGKDLSKNYPKLYAVMFCAVILNTAAQLILQLTDTQDLADGVKYTAALFRAVLMLCIILYVITAVKERKKLPWLMAAICSALWIGESAKMLLSAATGGQNDYSLFAMTMFLFALACGHIIQMTRDYKAEAETSARLAMAASEAKGKFLANMSHEIRTPLNAVLGMDEMILRESTEPKVREYAMDIFSSGQMLLSLINDILDLSKIESGKMEIISANYDMSSMIHDLSNMTELRAKKKNLRFHVEADRELPSVLFGDDVRVRQVLTNILTNAVKYTQEGDIWLRIRKEKTENKTVTIYFETEDTGIGIKEEDLPKLFADFERIEESRNRSIEGTGLGMSITMQLLNMMGSRLQVESVYGKGSKFYFYLEQTVVDGKPIGAFEQNVQRLAAEYTYASGFTAPDAEVLVVDDNAINRKVFGNLLNQTRVKITEADSGPQCLELTKRKRFDVIFLDHMMPDMDGVETLKRLRADSENPCRDVPVAALTANAVSGAKERYLEIGFNAYLSKPIVSEKLEKVLLDFLPKELIKEAAAGNKPKPAAEKPDFEQFPVVDGLDWNYAWLHLSGTELLKSTVEAFYEQIPSSAEKLESCYGELTGTGNFDSYRIQVHAMKSLAATLGILPLAGMAKVLEDAAKNERAEIIHGMHKIFSAEWNSYHEKLTGVFGIKSDEEKNEPEDISVICALLEMVNIAMQDMDVDTADEKMKIICSYRYKDEVRDAVEILKTAVENLDPEQAESCVREIIEKLSKKENV